MSANPDDLVALEHSLWQRDTRFDREAMDALFATDFHEIGRSGTSYTRDQMLFTSDQAKNIPATLHNLTIAPLGPDLFQVMYLSELRYDAGDQWAWRCSLWDRAGGAWQLRYHQGTPTQERP